MGIPEILNDQAERAVTAVEQIRRERDDAIAEASRLGVIADALQAALLDIQAMRERAAGSDAKVREWCGDRAESAIHANPLTSP